MYIFYDRIGGRREVLSDAFSICENAAFYEVPGKMMKTVENNDFDIGANPSQEEQQEELDSNEEMKLDVVFSCKLQECNLIGSKKDLLKYFKDYMKKVMPFVPEDEMDEFKKQAAEKIKSFAANFDDFTFYMGEGAENEEAQMIIPFKYNDDGMSGTFYFMKPGLEKEKSG